MTRVAVLGASGGVGRELVRQAMDRGDEVLAISRHPDSVESVGSGTLRRLAIDVFDLEAASGALRGADLVLSALGVAGGDKPGVLSAGVRAVTKAEPPRIVSVGASAPVAPRRRQACSPGACSASSCATNCGTSATRTPECSRSAERSCTSGR